MSIVEVTEEEVQKFHDVAVDLAKKAGKIVVDAIGDREKIISTKLSATDLVTQTDKAVEKMLFDELRKVFPDHQFIGEESTSDGTGSVAEFTNAPTWIIDPIDGTMNFVHAHPMVSISIGLVINKRAIVAVIFAPMMDQLYTAIKGKGAFLNGNRIKVSGVTEIQDAMLLMEVHARETEEVNKLQLDNIGKVLPAVQSFRTIGSAAIDLAFVACGSSDAFFHFGGIHCWDVVAGALLVVEAGGYVCDSRNGGEFNYMNRQILATSSESLAKQILATGIKTVDFRPDFDEHCPL